MARKGVAELLRLQTPLTQTLTGGRQGDGVPCGITVDGPFNLPNAQTGVDTQEVGNEASNVWGGHRRSGVELFGLADPIKVRTLLKTTSRVDRFREHRPG